MPASNAPRGAVDQEQKPSFKMPSLGKGSLSKTFSSLPKLPSFEKTTSIHPVVALAVVAVAGGTGLLSWWATKRIEERQDEIGATKLGDWLPVLPGPLGKGIQGIIPKVLRKPEIIQAILRNTGVPHYGK